MPRQRVADGGEPRRGGETAAGRTVADAELRATLMTRLVAVSEMLTGATTVDAAAVRIGRAALILTDAPRAAVFLRAQDGTVTCPWSHNLSDRFIESLCTPADVNAWTHLSHHPELACMDLPRRGRGRLIAASFIPDMRRLPPGNEVRRLAERERILALCAWPVARAGRVLAALVCYYDAPHVCRPSEQEIVVMFILQAATVLEHARRTAQAPPVAS